MTDPRQPSPTQQLADSLLMPFRALFVGEEGRFHLSSMRDERMRRVAAYCSGRVLDIGCGPGNLFIDRYIGRDAGVGIDVHPYPGVDLVVEDMTRLPYDEASFDTVTLVAVGGHIPEPARVAEFAEFARVLKPGGRLVMTEGEPLTQWFRHKYLEVVTGGHDMDSERGMEEEEQYCMPRREIFAYLNTPPLRLIRHERFQWHLNNVYVAEKASGNRTF